jgi:hypothetical protein
MDHILKKGFPKDKIQSLSIPEAITYLREKLKENYLIITLGPGDVWKVADAIAKTD